MSGAVAAPTVASVPTRRDRRPAEGSFAVARGVLVAGAVVIGVQFVGLVIYSTFLFHRFDLTDDFATYAQAWWSIGHGHINPVDTIQTPSYPFWQSHFELALWPVAWVGRIWPNAVQLLWLQDAAIAATEWLAFSWAAAVISERGFRAGRALTVAALAFLVVNPWWFLTASFDVHFETLGLPLALWSAYSLWRGRPRTALLTAAVALLFGDVVAVTVLCVGIAGLLSPTVRRRCPLGIPLAMVAGAVAWLALIAALGANRGSGLVTNYGYLVGAAPTASSGWVVTRLAIHPGHALRTLGHRLPQMARVVASAGLLGVLTPWGLLVALGTLVPSALNQNRLFLSPTIAFQTVAVVPFVFVGTVIVLVHVAGGRSPRRRGGEAPGHTAPVPGWRAPAALGLAAAVCALSLVQNLPLYATVPTDWWKVDAGAAASLRGALPSVPPDAQVIASQGVIGRFGTRTYVYPLLAAPQRFPVRRRQVVIVVAAGQGIEPVPAAAAEVDVAAAVRRLGARVVRMQHGVTVLTWSVPPGVRTVVLPP
jgi:uncharacterized membrane protein